MARGTPSIVLDDFQAPPSTPIWLVKIATGGTPATVYWTSRDHDVLFAGDTYSTRGFTLARIAQAGQGETGAIDLTLVDVNGYFNGLFAAGCDFRGRRAEVRQTSAGAIGVGSAATDSVFDQFRVDGYDRREGAITLHLIPLAGLFDLDFPTTVVTRAEFPGLPLSGTGLY